VKPLTTFRPPSTSNITLPKVAQPVSRIPSLAASAVGPILAVI
jgi:hypothetical protein